MFVLFLLFLSVLGQELLLVDIDKNNIYLSVKIVSELQNVPLVYTDYHSSPEALQDGMVELPLLLYKNQLNKTFRYVWPVTIHMLSRWVDNCKFGNCYEMVNSLKSLRDMKLWQSRFNASVQIMSAQKPELHNVAMLLPSVGISHIHQEKGIYANVTFITNIFGKTVQVYNKKLGELQLLNTLLPPIVPSWSLSHPDVQEILYEFARFELHIHIDGVLSDGWIRCSEYFPEIAFVQFRANASFSKISSIHMFYRSVHYMLATSGGAEVYDWIKNATSGRINPYYRRSSDNHGTVSANNLWSFVRSRGLFVLYVYDDSQPATCDCTNYTFHLTHNDHESLPESLTPGTMLHYRDGHYFKTTNCLNFSKTKLSVLKKLEL